MIAVACAMSATEVSAQRIAVLSDVHVSPGNACDSALRVAVAEINKGDYPLVVMNGDLTNEGSDKELANVKSILDGITHPLRVVPGNHEDNWSQSATKTFVDLWGNDRFSYNIGDSLIVVDINCGPYMKMGDGHIKQEDLHWLRRTLDTELKPGMRVLSMNHYPIRKDDLDNYIDYANLLAGYPVVAHINGHYHSWMQYEAAGIPCAMTRALDMRNGTYGYAIVDIAGDSVKVYEKIIGREPTLRFAMAVNEHLTPIQSIQPQLPAGLPAGVNHAWTDSASIFTRLAIDSDRVYFGTSLGQARAIDRATGKLAWSTPLGASLFSRPVVLPGGKVAFPHHDGIAIIDGSTGIILNQLLSAEGPYVADGVLSPDSAYYIQGGYKRMEARDARTMDLIWTYDSINNYCQAAPAIAGREVIFGAWDTYLRNLDLATGRLNWKWSNGKSQNLFSPGNVVPVVNETEVVIVAPDRYATGIDRATGKQLWRDNSHRYRESLGKSPDSKRAYAKTMDGELVCLDATTPEFKELWLTDLGLGYEHAPCIVLEQDGVIYLGSRRGIVTAVNADSHEVMWQLPLGVSEVNGIDLGPDGSVWASLIEGSVWQLR